MAGMDQKDLFALIDYGSGLYKVGIAGFCTFLPCFAGPDARHHGRYEPELPFRAHRLRQWHVQSWYYWFLHLAMCFLPWFAGPDARHHGRYEPEGQYCANFRQWHVQGWFTVDSAPRAMFPSCLHAQMLGIMAGVGLQFHRLRALARLRTAPAFAVHIDTATRVHRH